MVIMSMELSNQIVKFMFFESVVHGEIAKIYLNLESLLLYPHLFFLEISNAWL